MIQGAEAVDRERPRHRIGMIGAERADVALVEQMLRVYFRKCGFPRHQREIKVPALDLGDIRLLELSGNPLGAVRGRLCSHIQESLHGRACDLRPVFLTFARAQRGPGKELLR
jgi:hypothetical protein